MDTYLLWALNTLFQELFNIDVAPNLNNAGNSSFQNYINSQAPTSSTSDAASTSMPTSVGLTNLPIPEGASSGVKAAINAAAHATGLSPALLKALATVESGLNPHAQSSAGAVGLMQLMPATAQSLGVNPHNVAQNALGGAEFLKGLLSQFGHNVSLALAAYNAGPGTVEHYGGIPPYAQTQQYVNDVLSVYQAAMKSPASTPLNSSWIG